MLRAIDPCGAGRAFLRAFGRHRRRRHSEADLDVPRRLDTDPAASQPFEWTGFRDPQARRRRWEEDGWLGRDSAQLAVSLPDGTLAGIVSWRTIKAGGPDGGRRPAGMSASRREITRNG